LTDILLAIANTGLAFVFFPQVWENMKSHCGITLWTSIPRTMFIALLCLTYLANDYLLAGSVLLIDIACWLVIITQRIRRKA
jgi:hypothetical protein